MIQYVYDAAGNRLSVRVDAVGAVNRPPGGVVPALADGAEGVATDVTLEWSAAIDPDPAPDHTVVYRVFLDTVDPPTVAYSRQETAYTPSGRCLEPATVYYWRVVALDTHHASTSSPVWRFTTAAEHAGGVCRFSIDDWDGDGAPTVTEAAAGTSVVRADTDGDGLPDGWEIAHGVDPLRANADEDDDDDGLTNREELALGSHPMNLDTDGDGLGDGYEAEHGFSVFDPVDGQLDRDDDGLNNAGEFAGGSDPGDPASLPDPIGYYVASIEDPWLPRGWFNRRETYTLPMVDGYTYNWTLIRDACALEWQDNCSHSLATGIVDVRSDDPNEVIEGAPGHFTSDALITDWFGVSVCLDTRQCDAHTYEFDYAVVDEFDNWSTVTCRVRVEAP